MTAPASIMAPFAAPAGRMAGSDGASAVAGGFEALLSMLAGVEGQSSDVAGSKRSDPASADTADGSADTTAVPDSALASWLAQTLGQTPGQYFAAPRPDGPWGQLDPMSASSASGDNPPASGPATGTEQGLPLPDGLQPGEGPVDLAALRVLRASGTGATPTASSSSTDLSPATPPAPDAAAGRDRPTPPMVRTADDAGLARSDPPTTRQGPSPVSPSSDTLPTATAEVSEASSATPVAEVAAASSDKAAVEAALPALTLPSEPKVMTARRSPSATATGIAAASARTSADSDSAPSPVDIGEAAIDEGSQEASPAEILPDPVDPAAARTDSQAQTGPARADGLANGSPAALAPASAAQAKVTSETVTRLVAGIVDRLGGQSSRFDLQLDPHGLGKVDVSVEIGADGRLAARLNFDNAQAASDLRGRAQDLRQALEQAGFSLGEGSLSFDFAGQNRDSGQSFDDSGRADQAGRAFARAMGVLEDEAVLPVRFQTRRGLDLLI